MIVWHFASRQMLFKPCFKHNSAHMLSLNLTHILSFELGFICSSLPFTTKRANAFSPGIHFFKNTYLFQLHKKCGNVSHIASQSHNLLTLCSLMTFIRVSHKTLFFLRFDTIAVGIVLHTFS